MSYSNGEALNPPRTRIDIEPLHTSVSLMPGYAPFARSGLVVKVIAFNPNNHHLNIPSIHAIVLVLNPATGVPMAILEGGVLTALRTGAGSGVATDVLARTNATTVTIIGSGTQAHTQLEAVCTVRPIEKVFIYDTRRSSAEAFASQVRTTGQISADIAIVENPNLAVSTSDIVCTATNSDIPVFDGKYLGHGTHINAIGSYRKDMRELDSETMRKSEIFVDCAKSVLEEVGEIHIPIQAGQISREWVPTEIGDVLMGRKPGRSGDKDITVFKSVGLAIQDAVAASAILEEAHRQDLGTNCDL